MIGSYRLFVLFLLINVTIIYIISYDGWVQFIIKKFKPFRLFEITVLGLAKNVYKINGLHENEELFEINAGKLKVSLKLAEKGVENGELKFLWWSFAVCGCLLKFTPVEGTWMEFVRTDAHEHVVFMEDWEECQKLVGVRHFFVPTRVVFKHMEE